MFYCIIYETQPVLEVTLFGIQTSIIHFAHYAAAFVFTVTILWMIHI